ncbi:MAG TPA: hypothetical protein VIL69_24635 [Roseomonas sp.]|jgi:hypothetical protein
MILISGIINTQPDLILDQITLYNATMGGVGACCHILHVNADAVRKGLLAELKLPANAFINPLHMHTKQPTFLGCHVANILFAARGGLPFTHVYLHTDSDLPYRPGLGEHIRAHDLGLKKPNIFDPDKSISMWAQPVGADARLRNFVYANGGGVIYQSRYEGMFATRELMNEIMLQMATVWPFDENHWRGDYPYEEFALPTIVENIVRHRNLRRSRHAVMTAPSHGQYGLGSRMPLLAEHIPLLKKEPPDVFSAKFAPSEIDSPVRVFARTALGLAESNSQSTWVASSGGEVVGALG